MIKSIAFALHIGSAQTERLTKPFNSRSLRHQRWLAFRSLLLCFLDELIGGGQLQCPMENYTPLLLSHVCSLRAQPWEWFLLISQSQEGWRLVCPIGWDPCFPPGYHIVVSSCWLLFSATWEGRRLLAARSSWAPFTLTPTFSSSLSLWGLLIQAVVCSHRTQYCRYVMQSKRRDDLSFSTACVSQLCSYLY